MKIEQIIFSEKTEPWGKEGRKVTIKTRLDQRPDCSKCGINCKNVSCGFEEYEMFGKTRYDRTLTIIFAYITESIVLAKLQEGCGLPDTRELRVS